MIITPTQRIDVEIIPEILQMPIYYLEQNGYIPLAFFTELGASEEDIKAIMKNSSFNESSILEVQINQQDAVLVISHNLATCLITQLAVMPQYPIFASISRKLLLKSFESGAITVDDFTVDFRQDSVFWHSKISNLPTQIDSLEPTFITPHPQVDFATISRLDDHELDAYFDLNPAYISYKVTEFLCNCQLPLTHDIWRDYLLKCLYFHSRELQYEYFLYHLLSQDENVCLLTQTLLTDWMLEGRFCLDIPH